MEQAVQLEARALRKLESRNKGSARKWKDCDTADGYDRAKHAYAHFRLAVALQAQGALIEESSRRTIGPASEAIVESGLPRVQPVQHEQRHDGRRCC